MWTASLAGLVFICELVRRGLMPGSESGDDPFLGEKIWAWAGFVGGGVLLTTLWLCRRALLSLSAWRWILAVFALAAVGRAVVLLTIPYVPSDDFYMYHQSGIGVAKHGTMAVPADSRRNYYCFYPPGQVYTLGALYRVFGGEALLEIPASRVPETPEQLAAWHRAARVGMGFNVLLGSLTVVGIYGLGRRLAGEFAGRAASVLAAVVPSCLLGTFLLGAEVAQTFWVVLALYAYARWAEAVRGEGVSPAMRIPRVWPLVLAGACLGMACLHRPTFLPWAGLLAIHAVLISTDKRRALLSAAGMLLAMAAVIAPWTIRNYRVTGAFIPVSSNGGGNLYSANNPLAEGAYTGEAWEELFDEADTDEALHRLGMEKATRWIRENPRAFAELAAVKFRLFWSNDRDIAWWVLEAPTTFYQKDWAPPNYARTTIAKSAQQAGEGVSTGVYLSILAASAVGLWRHRRRLRDHGGWATIALLAGFLTAIHMVFESQAKYHYTLVPLLCVWAGMAVEARGQAQSALNVLNRVDALEIRNPKPEIRNKLQSQKEENSKQSR